MDSPVGMLYLAEKNDGALARPIPGRDAREKDAPMSIELKCYATLAPLTPGNANALPIHAGETVLELLTRLSIPKDEIKIVFVNGVTVELDRPLADGDRVGVFPPVGGG